MPDRPTLFLPECHADTALIRFLFPDPLLTIHTTGCPDVARTMKLPRADDYRLIGIVDNDKKLMMHCKGFFGYFDVIEEVDRLSVRKHPETAQHIVIIDKAIETFLLWNAAQISLDVSLFGFATDIKRLGNQLKTPAIETDPDYQKLLAELFDKKAPGFVSLQRVLTELMSE
ncbi:MAG: hypothetical protein H7319_01415 [Spirosoma sp.]|nr:hypothetical protein [Spirosoma sp.]